MTRLVHTPITTIFLNFRKAANISLGLMLCLRNCELQTVRSLIVDACVYPRRVLVVEDDASVRDLIVEVLIDDGFEVHAVAEAHEALSHLGARWPIDVLFTDVELPGEIDGARLALLARKLRPDLAIVYTSGRVRNIDQVPGSAFVAKPYEPGVVCALLTRLTQRRRRYSLSPPLARNASSQWM
jgi:CheY-like chemotaxis protein